MPFLIEGLFTSGIWTKLLQLLFVPLVFFPANSA
jgi:hypothetical protein